MGIIMSYWSRLFGVREVRVLVLGLDAAGKTTILHRIHSNEVVHTVPTIGFEVETVQIKNLKLQVWDLGGQTSIRPYWRCYYPNTNAVIYVIDSADRERLPDAKKELSLLLGEEELRGVPLLVFANKQDLPNALDAVTVSEGLGLAAIKDRQYAIFQASATKGVGIAEGVDWMVDVIASK